MIEITTIGAGGGSIARVDAGGLLRVGPESAGSVPGPACYGQGNERPTVTDANLVLGRIDAERPLGGDLDRLDTDAARAALERHVGEPLGLDAVGAAAAVVEVANARLAGAIRLISVERGHDPERFALMPFGGAGGLHVGALMREVGCRRALIPRFPGITSALGCVLADVRHDFVHTINVAPRRPRPGRAGRGDARHGGARARAPGARGRRAGGHRGRLRAGHGLPRPEPRGRRPGARRRAVARRARARRSARSTPRPTATSCRASPYGC